MFSAAVSAIMLVGSALAILPTVAFGQDLVPGPGSDLVARACSDCHGLEHVTSARKDAGGWRDTVMDMVRRGAALNAAQVDEVSAYLTANYNVQPSSVRGAGAGAAPTPAQPAGRAPAPVAPMPAVPAVTTEAQQTGMAVQRPGALAQPCCAPTTSDFPKVGGNYGNQNYSALNQVNRSTVGKLGAAWRNDLEGGIGPLQQQSSVVAVGGVLYVETTQGKVYAVDGRTGVTKWVFAPGYGTTLRRGVAVGEGLVFANMTGRRVLALDQETGKPVWERILVDEGVTGSMRAPVTYFDGLVYVGTSNERRGVALALDAKTGRTVWKFYATPEPGEPGSETWKGDSWKTGGGSPWMNPAIDPELGLIYWTFGDAKGDPTAREGQNLFTNALVAFDAKTGKMRWYYQSVHHDVWDLDNVMAPVLADVKVAGVTRKAVVYGSKTGMVYVLDRVTGALLGPVVERPVPQSPSFKTWPTQPYPVGDALLPLCPPESGAGAAPPYYAVACLFTPPSNVLTVHMPGHAGGPNWGARSFSPRTGLVYMPIGIVASARLAPSTFGFRPLGHERGGALIAYDPATQKIAWSQKSDWALAHGGGVLTTAGDLIFIGKPDGLLAALDIRNGKQLWSFQTGVGVNSTPASYEIDGEQYIAVFAGGNTTLYGEGQVGDHLWAFKLGGKAPPAANPAPVSIRQQIEALPVEGSVVNNTVNLARLWKDGAVVDAESVSQDSMAPQKLRVPLGASVTFLNPAGNTAVHCATQFFDGLFNSGPLKPGESFTYKFETRGEYFYNDCSSPGTTGIVIVH